MSNVIAIETLKRAHARALLVARILLQKIIAPVLLFVVYFVGVGCTAAFTRAFFRKALTHSSLGPDTDWVAATGYDADLEKSLRQS